MRRTVAVRAAASGCAGGGPASAVSTETAASPPRLRLREAHRPRPARRGQRDRGGPGVVVDVHRGQLRDAVGAQRAAQVDGLAAGAAKL